MGEWVGFNVPINTQVQSITCTGTITQQEQPRDRTHKYHNATRNSTIADKPCDAFRGRSRSSNRVPFYYVGYGFLLVCYSNFVPNKRHFLDIRVQKCRDLENWVRGPWRSLKMSPFDREPTTSYWRSIVTMALSRVVLEIFNVKKYHDLEIPVKGQTRVSRSRYFSTNKCWPAMRILL